jgi:hypothetical protein
LWVHAVLAVVVLGGVLVAACRASARRELRIVLVAACGIVTLACAYRVRADTWQDDNLINGDRYFYISRVLLAWLFILEFEDPSRTARILARGACLIGILTHVPHFKLPAPPDYHWAEHCDPIRRGEPANIYTLPEGWWIEYPGRGKKA